MRIAIVGTQNTGKSLLIKNFLERWPMYSKASPTYRDFIDDKTPLNQQGTRDAQETIREALVKQALENQDHSHCIHDRCILDNLVYTLWLADKGKIDDDAFIAQSFNITREILKLYDVIFMLTIDEKNPVPIENRNTRDTNLIYREEINNLFLGVYESYQDHDGLIFPLEDCPGVIIIRGDETKGEKIKEIANYLNDDGNLVEDESTLTEELEQEFFELNKEIQKQLLEKKNQNNKGRK